METETLKIVWIKVVQMANLFSICSDAEASWYPNSDNKTPVYSFTKKPISLYNSICISLSTFLLPGSSIGAPVYEVKMYAQKTVYTKVSLAQFFSTRATGCRGTLGCRGKL